MKRIGGLLILFAVLTMLVGCAAPSAAPTPTPVPPKPTSAPPTTVPPTAMPTTPRPTPAPTAIPMGTGRLLLATTTSTRDSGLLDFILPDFEEQYNVKVDVVAVGSGQAMRIGQDGNAEVLLVHSPAAEQQFMADGHGVRREDVMYNDFIIVGPAADPAGINGMRNAAKAFGTIAENQASFVSRGDDSGTHAKEKSIWSAAGITPSGAWYISAGQGMGAVLTMANETLAYTLSDRATYLARKAEGLQLDILVEGDDALFNPYGVIAVNPAKNPQIKGDLAQDFIDWLISVDEQEKIGTFGADTWGQPLFFPDSQPYREAHAATSAAALRITGKVAQEMAWTEDEVKAMPTMEAERANKQGTMETYTGVSLAMLLELAGPAADATTVVSVADDGFTADMPLADALAYENCILSFRTQGGFSAVLPDFSSKLQVKGVIEIQVN